MPGQTGDTTHPHSPTTPPPTDTGVCAISPPELVGYTGNALNRITALEQRVAELEAGNVEANQLSDLSQQVGWVGGVTYLGVEGWIQTEYGTLIPPAGFTLLGSGVTMSDGNTYSAVVYDEDGVLQYGFGQTQPDGTFTAIAGESASSGASQYIVLKSDDTVITGGNPDMILHDSAGSVISFNGADAITVSQSGLYRIAFFVPVVTNAAGTAALLVEIGSIQIGTNKQITASQNHYFQFAIDYPMTAAQQIQWSLTNCSIVSHNPGTNQALISVTKI